MLDRSCIAIYDTNAGFRVSLDAAYNLSLKAVYFATISFVSKLSEEAKANTASEDQRQCVKVDFNSGYKHPRWLDGYHWYRWRKFDPSMCLCIEVVAVSVDDFSVKYEGWSFLPLFQESEYVQMGNFYVPLVSLIFKFFL